MILSFFNYDDSQLGNQLVVLNGCMLGLFSCTEQLNAGSQEQSTLHSVERRVYSHVVSSNFKMMKGTKSLCFC